MNKVNFHNYIDGIPNVVFITKLENGRIVAAYTEAPFQKGTDSTGKMGLMFELKTRKLFTLRETTAKTKVKARPTSWDEHYILFGNSDLRFPMNGVELSSNYGTPNGSFDNRAVKDSSIDDLFG